jgi:acetyl esterase/lipase
MERRSSVGRPTTYTYKTVAGCQVKADVYESSGGGPSVPTIVYIHGGALITGSRSAINTEQLALYLDASYCVVSIDYRLAPETKLPGIIEDVTDAVQWVAESGPKLFSADRERIAVVGHSAGGYLALLSGVLFPSIIKAVVSFYGYGDLVGSWYSEPDPFYCSQPRVRPDEFEGIEDGPEISETHAARRGDRFYLYCRQQGLWPEKVGGRHPVQDAAFFVPYCPIQNVSSEYPPTLLLHGDKDTDVPYEQSKLMAEVFTQHDVEHEFITIPNGGHGFDRDMENPIVRDAFRSVLSFLERRFR